MQILVVRLQMQNFVTMHFAHSSKKCYKIFRMLSKPNFFSWLNESKFRVYITIFADVSSLHYIIQRQKYL